MKSGHIYTILLSLSLLFISSSVSAQTDSAYLVEINRQYSCYLAQNSEGNAVSRLAKVKSGADIEEISAFISFDRKIRRWRTKARVLRSTGNDTGFLRRRGWIKRTKQCRKKVGDYEFDTELVQETTKSPIVLFSDTVYESPVSDNACDVAGDTGISRNYRILRGDSCEIGNSPVVQLLLYFNGERRASFVCSGTAIAGNVVLFAAHCVGDGISAIEVIPGGDRSQSLFASSVIANSNFNFSVLPRGRGDVALAFLDEVLPTRTLKILTDDNIKAGERSIIAGYGLVDSVFPGIASDEFDGLHAGSARIDEVRSTEIMTRYTQSNPNQANTCSGDSGGPLLIKRDGEWKLAGVTSFGTSSNCNFGELSGYSKLSDPENIDFINRHAPGILDED